MTNFITIRTAAKLGILPEHRLRQMVHTGECPGFYSGNRFLINVEQLKELLDMGALTQEEFDKKKKELLGL